MFLMAEREWDRARFYAEYTAINRILESGDLVSARAAAKKLLGSCLAAGEEAYPGADYDMAMAHFTFGRVLINMGAAQAALETLRELRSKKIDSFVFSSGELRNGVSLGIFGQRSSATRLLNDMKRKGYEATLLEREGEEQRFWISLGPKNAVRLTEDLQAALRERYAEARYSREECP